MSISVKIIADSLAPSGVRLLTWKLRYPRMMHSEFMTHRVFSRNASSSRAIPVDKQIQDILDDPAIPIAFTKNKPGMQGGEEMDGHASDLAKEIWLRGMNEAVKIARGLKEVGLHKQYANRVLEPYAHISVVATATEVSNFFALRYHSMAMPEFQEVSKQMWESSQTSIPRHLKMGEWHLPFVTDEEREAYEQNDLLTLSVGRCARVSYNNHDGTPAPLDKERELYQRLLGNFPIHASPAEHQAMADSDVDKFSGNLRGWIQYRKTIESENITHFEGPLG